MEGLIFRILCNLDWKRSSQWLNGSEGLLISPSQDFSRQNDPFQSFGMLLLGSNHFLIYENTIVNFFLSFYFIQMKCPISGEHWIPPNRMLITNLRLHLHLISSKVFIIALARWSGDVIRRTGMKNFIAVSQNRARPYFRIQHGRGEVRTCRVYLNVHSVTGNVVDTDWSVEFWRWKCCREFGNNT